MLGGVAHKIRRALDEWRYELIIFTLVAIAAASGVLSSLQNAANDRALQFAKRPPSGEIVIVQIDARSINAVDTWPWPRSRHGEIIKRLRAAGADLVALDIDFSSPSDPAEDRALANALAAAQGRVILPSFVQHASRGVGNELVETNPLPMFRDHALIGNANVFAPSGAARRASYGLYLADGRYRPTFAALIGQKGQAIISEFEIDFGLDSAAIQRISASDVLNGTFDPNLVKGKRVIVGASAIELGDYVPVPVRGVIPGVELQALMAESILQGRTLMATGPFGSLMLTFATLMLLRPSRSNWSIRGLGIPLMATATVLTIAPAAVLAAAPVLLETVPALAASLICLVCIGFKELSARAHSVLRERSTGNLRRVMVDLIVDESSDGVVVADQNGRIELCNERAAALLSATRSTLISRRIDKHLPRFEDLSSTTGNDLQRNGEMTVDCDGGPTTLEVSIRRTSLPTINDSAAPTRIDVYTLRDVTQRRRAEEAERNAQMERLIAERAKSNFVANMSHELRTPLNAIIGFAEMMANQIMGPMGQPQYVEFSNVVAKSGHHLLALVNNILEISRIDNDPASLCVEEIDFEECAAAAAAVARVSRDSKSQTINVRVAEGAKRVRTDRRVIKHTLANLLSNAVKFTAEKGTIEVRAWTEGDSFLFEVEDNGRGIDPALMPHLTDLFRHADNSFTRGHEGMGAGLYLVKRFVELMRGSLTFDSTLGKGTRVRVALAGAAVAPTKEAEAA
jgi:signal transduction histidine kinase